MVSKHRAYKKIDITFLLILLINTLSIGQKLLIDQPKLLTNSVNSIEEDTYPLLSHDGRTLYFVRTFHPQNTGAKLAGQDIWYSKKDDSGTWLAAQNLSTLNTVDNNVVVGISYTDDILYLLNTYSGPLRQNRIISFSTREADKWSEPEELNLVFRKRQFGAILPAENLSL